MCSICKNGIKCSCVLPVFDCLLKNCVPKASLAWLPVNHFNPAMSYGSFKTYNAVYAVAHALQEMLLQEAQTQPTGTGDNMLFFPWQVM